MLLSNPPKILLACLFFLYTACGDGQGTANRGIPFIPAPSSEAPFATKEPDDFQAELVVITESGESSTLVARKGAQRRTDFNYGTPAQYSLLIAGETYLMLAGERVYAEPPGGGSPHTAPLLADTRAFTEFEETGRDGAVTTYRARVAGAGRSEVLIHFNADIGLPVRQEFYSLHDGGRVLKYAWELRNFRIGADAALFSVPDGFRKIPHDEFMRRFHKLPINAN